MTNETDKHEQESNEPETFLESAIGWLLCFSGPILIIAGFSSGHWLYDLVPSWVNLAGMGIGALLTWVLFSWKWMIGVFGAVMFVFNYMPGGLDPHDVWIPRIHSPEIGDIYTVNTFAINDKEATDDNKYVFYRVTQFNNHNISFESSLYRYSFDAINDKLRDKSAFKESFHNDSITYSKIELEKKLKEYVVTGVFRQNP